MPCYRSLGCCIMVGLAEWDCRKYWQWLEIIQGGKAVRLPPYVGLYAWSFTTSTCWWFFNFFRDGWLQISSSIRLSHHWAFSINLAFSKSWNWKERSKDSDDQNGFHIFPPVELFDIRLATTMPKRPRGNYQKGGCEVTTIWSLFQKCLIFRQNCKKKAFPKEGFMNKACSKTRPQMPCCPWIL